MPPPQHSERAGHCMQVYRYLQTLAVPVRSAGRVWEGFALCGRRGEAITSRLFQRAISNLVMPGPDYSWPTI